MVLPDFPGLLPDSDPTSDAAIAKNRALSAAHDRETLRADYINRGHGGVRETVVQAAEAFTYDPDSGVIATRVAEMGPVGPLPPDVMNRARPRLGKAELVHNGVSYSALRLAYTLMGEKAPSNPHYVNGNPCDLRWANIASRKHRLLYTEAQPGITRNKTTKESYTVSLYVSEMQLNLRLGNADTPAEGVALRSRALKRLDYLRKSGRQLPEYAVDLAKLLRGTTPL